MTNQKSDSDSDSDYKPLLFKVASAAISGRSLGALRLKLGILTAGFRHRDTLRQIAAQPKDSALQRFLDHRPEALGLLIWPYQSAEWDVQTRLERFQAHFSVIDAFGPPLDFPPGQKLVLAELDHIHPELRLVLDQPLWMMREGGLTFNLFIGTFRTFSLTFSFYRDASGQLEVLIGGCQGRDTDGILDTYRALTKSAHGLRPRDLLLECFGMLCRILDVQKIRAIGDANRHRRHPFFKQTGDFKQSYDSVWTERGGTLLNDGFYQLPVESIRKDLAEIKAKKRSMYRKRFEFLDNLEQQMPGTLKTATPIVFAET